jgi:SAM-dependent methyltransferase
MTRQSGPAALRNREPILGVLQSVLPGSGLVLELASGTGEHAVYFARHLPGLTWQPSDPSLAARQSIAGWTAAEGLENVLPPLDLDAAGDDWPITHAAALVCINMIHISPWESTLGLLRGAGQLLTPGAPLYLYGPYKRRDHPLEPSNAAFDQSLRSRDPRWGLRELDEVAAAAAEHGLLLDRVMEMPANNLSVVFRKSLPPTS